MNWKHIFRLNRFRTYWKLLNILLEIQNHYTYQGLSVVVCSSAYYMSLSKQFLVIYSHAVSSEKMNNQLIVLKWDRFGSTLEYTELMYQKIEY